MNTNALCVRTGCGGGQKGHFYIGGWAWALNCPRRKGRVILFWQAALKRLLCMSLTVSSGRDRCQKCHFYIARSIRAFASLRTGLGEGKKQNPEVRSHTDPKNS